MINKLLIIEGYTWESQRINLHARNERYYHQAKLGEASLGEIPTSQIGIVTPRY